MNRLAFGVAMPAVSIAGSAVAQGDFPSNKRRFDVGRFDAIDLAGSDDVRIVSGTAVSVVASGDPRAITALAIEVRGDTLRVAQKRGSQRDKGAIVTVTIPTLRAATISGAGFLHSCAMEGRRFVGRISGSDGMTLTGLRAGDARFDLPGSGLIAADGRTDAVTIDLGGSRRVATTGGPRCTIRKSGTAAVRCG